MWPPDLSGKAKRQTSRLERNLKELEYYKPWSNHSKQRGIANKSIMQIKWNPKIIPVSIRKEEKRNKGQNG